MRDITLLTKEPFEYEKVHDLIREAFKDFEVVTDSPDQDKGRIYLEKGRNNVIDIYFTPEDTMSNFQYEFEEEQLSMFPFDVYLTCVLFRGEEAINRLIQALINSGLEFWIHAESGDILKPKEFLPYRFYIAKKSD